MHTAVGNDMNEQMMVNSNSIDNFYLVITIIRQLPNFNHNILNSFIMIR